MKVTGSRVLTIPPAELWEMLADPQVLAAALPHSSPPEIVDETCWRAAATLSLGLGSLPVEISVTQLGSRPGESLRLAVVACGDGVVIEVEAELDLIPGAGAATELVWRAAVQVHGPAVASISQHALAPILERQVADLLDSLEARGAVA